MSWREDRVVKIPKDLSQKLGINVHDELEITFEYGQICIRKLQRENINLREYVGIIREMGTANKVSIPEEYIKLLGNPKSVKVIGEGRAIKLMT
ncbi:MAG: AbrB/MazE/SpoVT family DNA-binding domain-containing protein [Clostridiales bacterium]|nr:AbrB/MazE/SpoVT family DNA-binding domain-containing protein [Clostridiales bacterium]